GISPGSSPYRFSEKVRPVFLWRPRHGSAGCLLFSGKGPLSLLFPKGAASLLHFPAEGIRHSCPLPAGPIRQGCTIHPRHVQNGCHTFSSFLPAICGSP